MILLMGLTYLTPNFWAGATVAELAEAQGVGAIEDLDDLKGDFWPDDEAIDDFIRPFQAAVARRSGVPSRPLASR